MIYTIAYNKDNYAYFVETQFYNLLVDAGNFNDIHAYLEAYNKKPDYILLTHSHVDHIEDALKLKEEYKAQIIAAKALPLIYTDIDESQSHNLELSFISTPGHTEDSGLWLLDVQNQPLAIFCGDVLFSCGCGRQFQGIGENLYKAMKIITHLDERYQLCCGHEYTETNINFCQELFPNDAALRNYAFDIQKKRIKNNPTLPILLSKEKSINPFLRFNEKELWNGVHAQDSLDFLMKLRQLRDNY